MNVLVRLPNWLGDMVMAYAFLDWLQQILPKASIEVVVKHNLVDLVGFFPMVRGFYAFDKRTYKGSKGTYQFGRFLRKQKDFDLFFVLPDSHSSALMAYCSGATKRVGYANELRSMWLTHAYDLPKRKMHRVKKYAQLLTHYFDIQMDSLNNRFVLDTISLPSFLPKHQTQILLNLQSVAASRSLSFEKSVEIIRLLRRLTGAEIILSGVANNQAFMKRLCVHFQRESFLIDLSGKTSLKELTVVMLQADLVVSVDSGPAHLANALGRPCIVLFGAGDSVVTSPYEKDACIVLQEQLSCSPCVSNTCKLGTVECLSSMSLLALSEAVQDLL